MIRKLKVHPSKAKEHVFDEIKNFLNRSDYRIQFKHQAIGIILYSGLEDANFHRANRTIECLFQEEKNLIDPDMHAECDRLGVRLVQEVDWCGDLFAFGVCRYIDENLGDKKLSGAIREIITAFTGRPE